MTKYKPLPRVKLENREWPSKNIEAAPYLCSVDLRDGNQALAIPMSIEKKLKLFKLLVQIGFKEIEVGFPAASQIDFDFIRKIIEEKLVPDDVHLQILTQAREHLIIRSLESLQGAKNVIIHLYNSTSPLQRKITFNKSKEEIKQLAVDGTKLVKKLVPTYLADSNVRFQYSPESFSDTETDYALEVCEAVMDVWQPTVENKIILNLPETVQWAGPHVHADQIEWFCKNMKNRDKAIISLHTHNDRGTGIAASELGLLAGADRVEGTLFGNGERTGNLDIIALVLNMYSDGVEVPLNLENIPEVRRIYEECTAMYVPPRHPYAGDLVFTAFSGSHQDAIKKGLDLRDENNKGAYWEVPYLTIDPQDIGRNYEAIIRINSQSGKGGVAYILQYKFGYELPKAMHMEIGKIVNDQSDKTGRELAPEEIFEIFKKEFVLIDAPIVLQKYAFTMEDDGEENTSCKASILYNGMEVALDGRGNGAIDAFSKELIRQDWCKSFTLSHFHEQSLGTGSDSKAVSYIQLTFENDVVSWGVGIDSNINIAGIRALIAAYNRADKKDFKS